jgi:hypothetical protein
VHQARCASVDPGAARVSEGKTVDLRVWVWRSISLTVVALAVAMARWFMGHLANRLGSVNLAVPTGSIAATATTIAPASGTARSSTAPVSRSPSPSSKG